MSESPVLDHERMQRFKMEYRSLGNTGMRVSRFGLGGSALAGMYGDTDVDELCKMVQYGLDRGVNFIDTAPWYGNGRSEEVLGKALEGVSRDRYFMATKVGRYEPEVSRMFDFTAERTLSSVDHSLQLLGLEYVDIIQVHDVEFAPSGDIIVYETLPALQKVKDAGKARFIGITGYQLDILREIVEKSTVKIDTVLCYCHLSMNDSSLLDHLDYFKEKKIGVINASTLSMGLLTHQGPPSWHPAPRKIKDVCAHAAKYCQDRGVNLPRLAIDYTYSFSDVATTLTTTDTIAKLKDNLDVLEEGLTKEEKVVQEEVMDKYMRPLKNATWGESAVAEYWNKMNEIKTNAM